MRNAGRIALLLAAAGGVPACGGYGGDSTGPHAPSVRAYSMSAARADHTVTALGNGDLLVAGGTGVGDVPLSSCEVFDASAAGTAAPLSVCGSLAVARTRHTATLLVSGNVVAIGGASSGAVEEFAPDATTPSAGAWTTAATAVLPTPRSRHAAVRLPDGRVLVAGGMDVGGTTLASCSLYVGAPSPFAPAAPMNVARHDASATLLPDGRVLVAGGYDVSGLPLASSETYDPVLDAWTVRGSMATARAAHRATLLGASDADPTNDRVLVTGGADAVGDGVRSAELFDPATDLFTPGGALEGPGVFGHAAVLLENGQVGVVGGFASGGGAAPEDPVRETVVYRFGSGAGFGAQDVPGRRGALAAGTIPSAGPAGSDVVVVGGVDESGTPRADVWLFAMDDEATALADTLSDADAVALGVLATTFHVFTDGLTGTGDVDLSVEEHPVLGRRVVGRVGNFEVRLEVDAGSVTGDVEGKSYVLRVTDDYVDSPDFQVDFRPADDVEGDMDTAGEDFDFHVHQDAATYHGWVTGYDVEARLFVDVLADHTDPDASYMDVYLLW